MMANTEGGRNLGPMSQAVPTGRRKSLPPCLPGHLASSGHFSHTHDSLFERNPGLARNKYSSKKGKTLDKEVVWVQEVVILAHEEELVH